MSNKAWSLLVILPLITGFCPNSIFAQQTAHVTGVSVEANPTSHDGPCPKLFKFTGVITVNRGGKVKYRWFHSDGKHRPPASTIFRGPEAHTITDTWTLGTSSTPFHYDGYVRLQILSPTTSLSDKATFTLNCVPRGPQKKTQTGKPKK